MESFNKKMQDKFEDSSVNIPDELSWEALGPGIMEGVEKDPNRNKNILFFLLLFTGVLAIIFSSILIFNNSNKNNEFAENVENAEKNDKKNIDLLLMSDDPNSNNQTVSSEYQTKQSIKYTKTNSTLQRNELTDNSTIKNTSQTRETTYNKNALNVKENNASIIRDLNNKPTSAYKEKKSYASQDYQGIKNTQIFSESIDNSEVKDLNPYSSNLANETRKRANLDVTLLDFIPPFFSTNASVEARNIALRKPNDISESDNDSKKEKENIQSIGITSGLVLWTLQSKNFDLETYESTLPSWSTGLNYSLKLKKKFSLVTGLDYTAYRSRMSNIFTTVEENFNENAIQTVHNRVTGESHQVTGAIETITTRRQVIHHNTMHALSIPILLQYELPMKEKFALGIQTGISLNKIVSRDGRGISPDLELLEYSELENKNLNFISGIISFYAAYNITKSLSLDLNIDTSQPLNSIPFTAEDQRSISTYNFNIGLKKHF